MHCRWLNIAVLHHIRAILREVTYSKSKLLLEQNRLIIGLNLNSCIHQMMTNHVIKILLSKREKISENEEKIITITLGSLSPLLSQICFSLLNIDKSVIHHEYQWFTENSKVHIMNYYFRFNHKSIGFESFICVFWLGD